MKLAKLYQVAGASLCIFLVSLSHSAVFAQATKDTPSNSTAEKEDRGGMLINSFRLQHANANASRQIVDAAVQADGQAPPFVQIGIDPQTNSLIVLADQPTLDRVSELIRQLDQPTPELPEPVTTSVNLVIQLVMDAEEVAIPMATEVSTKIREILEEAGSAELIRPVAQPQVATHSLLRVNPGKPNSSDGKVAMTNSAMESSVHMSMDGFLHEQLENVYRLKTKIQIVLQSPDPEPEIQNKRTSKAEILTDTVITKNHPVLLAVNTVEGYDFLILVTVR